ncbi:MAG: hypothetical protein ABW044_05425 [Cellvibrio sp.]
MSVAQRAPKKRSNNQKKIASFHKRARKGMLGFSIAWADSDPFNDNGHITGGVIDHGNPTQKLICIDMWKRCSQWIVNTEFTWQVIMRVIYMGAPKGDKYDDYEFTFTCSLRGNKSEILNDAMEESLNESIKANSSYPDGDRHKGVYDRCEFLAVIVGV